jgi:uncharacterized short protein YbdD (DUF466 family)
MKRRSAHDVVAMFASIARRIAGVPDYDAYVAHVRAHHPERVVPTRAEFFAERLQARYRGGGGRCC